MRDFLTHKYFLFLLTFNSYLATYKVDDTTDEEDETVFVNENKNYDSKYSDYYKFIANSKAIRPICIAEDVDFENMSFVQRGFWWLGTILKV